MKRDLVIEKTLELIAKQSINDTPMSQIAKESKVAIGTIYHHFKSKDEIIKEIYLNIKKDFQRIIQQNLKEKESAEKNFKAVWTGIFEYYLNNPVKFKFLLQVSNSSYIDALTKEEGQLYFKDIVIFFQEGIQAGNFIKMDSTLMLELIHGNISSYVELILQNRLENTKTHLRHAIEFSWNAIKP